MAQKPGGASAPRQKKGDAEALVDGWLRFGIDVEPEAEAEATAARSESAASTSANARNSSTEEDAGLGVVHRDISLAKDAQRAMNSLDPNALRCWNKISIGGRKSARGKRKIAPVPGREHSCMEKRIRLARARQARDDKHPLALQHVVRSANCKYLRDSAERPNRSRLGGPQRARLRQRRLHRKIVPKILTLISQVALRGTSHSARSRRGRRRSTPDKSREAAEVIHSSGNEWGNWRPPKPRKLFKNPQ